MGEVRDRCWARAQGKEVPGRWMGKQPENWVSVLDGDGDSGTAHGSHGQRALGTVLLERMRHKRFSSNLLYFFVQETGVLLRQGDGSVVAQFADKSREGAAGPGPGEFGGSEAEKSRMG